MKIMIFKGAGKLKRVRKYIKAAKNGCVNPRVTIITTRCRLISNDILPKRYSLPNVKRFNNLKKPVVGRARLTNS